MWLPRKGKNYAIGLLVFVVVIGMLGSGTRVLGLRRYEAGVAALEKGNAQDAEKKFRSSARVWPWDYRVWWALGEMLEKTNPAESRESLERCLDLSKFLPCRYSLAWLNAAQEDVSVTRELMEEITRSSPNYYWGHYGYALALIQEGRTEEAREALGRASETDPNNLWGLLLLGESYGKEGSDEQAKKIYDQLIALAPSENRLLGDAYSNLSVALMHLGDPVGSLRAIEQAIAIYPYPDRILWTNYARALLENERPRDALAAAEKALSLHLDASAIERNASAYLPWRHYAVANELIYAETKDSTHREAATRGYKQVLEVVPDHNEAKEGLRRLGA